MCRRAKTYSVLSCVPQRLAIAVVLVLCICATSSAQDLKWVYATKSVSENTSAIVGSMVTDDLGNIYATGTFSNKMDFGDIEASHVIDPESNSFTFFVMKLDSQKKVKWIRSLKAEDGYAYTAGLFISLDQSNNVIVSGYVYPMQSEPKIVLQPGNNIIFQDLLTEESGMVLKFDNNGNYLYSQLIPDKLLVGAALDSNNNVVIACSSNYLQSTSTGIKMFYKTHLFKLDATLNITDEKVLDGVLNLQKHNPNSMARSNVLLCDTQNNLILRARFYESMVFDGTTYTATGWSNFVCKFNFSQELWYEKTDDNLVRLLSIDASDNIYMKIKYTSSPVTFNGQSMGVPVVGPYGDELLMKLDTQRNIIWKTPLLGGIEIMAIGQNSFGENIAVAYAQGLNYVNNEATLVYESDTQASIMLKLDSQGELMHSLVLTSYATSIVINKTDDDILLGGNFRGTVDFDPSPSNEVIRANDAENESSAFIMKLANCDTSPPDGTPNPVFCAGQNPTIASLEPKGYGINWFSSASSTQPLLKTEALVDGQSYFAAKSKVENCPEILQRFQVSVTVTPEPVAPQVGALQPCFSPQLRLSDLIVNGQDLTFYGSATIVEPLLSSKFIVADEVYYVTQKINGCESLRVPVSVSSQSILDVKNHYIKLCDQGNDNLETIDLSNYLIFIFPDYSAQDHTVTYHKSLQDANADLNPIANIQNYQSANTRTFVRVYSKVFLCHRVAELSVSFAKPPEITKIEVNNFVENNSLAVLPKDSNYEYSIDGQNYQDSNYFDRLGGGEYTVYAKEKSGLCDAVSKKTFVLHYPKFFTPNGDGINDFWKIPFAVFQVAVNVEIYDRYGKVIAVFGKQSQGWDGKLQGKNLPASDYWFKIRYTSQNEVIYTGHFSLVR